MDFAELIAALQSGEAGDTVYDDLTGIHAGLVQENEGAAAKVAELEASIAALTAEIADLKAKNYDLLMASAGETDTGASEDAEEGDEVVDGSETFDDIIDEDSDGEDD